MIMTYRHCNVFARIAVYFVALCWMECLPSVNSRMMMPTWLSLAKSKLPLETDLYTTKYNDSSPRIPVLILDVDGTLYEDDCNIEQQIRDNFHEFALRRFAIEPNECERMHKQYGSGIRGIAEEVTGSRDIFVDYYNEVYPNLDMTKLQKYTKKNSLFVNVDETGYQFHNMIQAHHALSLLKCPIVIASNSPLFHVKRVLHRLGLSQLPVDTYLTPDRRGGLTKSELDFWKPLLDLYPLDRYRCVLVDDNRQNTETVSQLGIDSLVITPECKLDDALLTFLLSPHANRQPFLVNEELYLESKNEVDREALNDSLLHQIVEEVVQQSKAERVKILDIGAGLLNMFPLLMDELTSVLADGTEKRTGSIKRVSYIALESNTVLYNEIKEGLFSWGLREVRDTGYLGQRLMQFEGSMGTGVGDIMVTLYVLDLDYLQPHAPQLLRNLFTDDLSARSLPEPSSTLSDEGHSREGLFHSQGYDLVVGASVADLHAPSAFLGQILDFAAEQGGLLYLPLTFAGQTRLVVNRRRQQEVEVEDVLEGGAQDALDQTSGGFLGRMRNLFGFLGKRGSSSSDLPAAIPSLDLPQGEEAEAALVEVLRQSEEVMDRYHHYLRSIGHYLSIDDLIEAAQARGLAVVTPPVSSPWKVSPRKHPYFWSSLFTFIGKGAGLEMGEDFANWVASLRRFTPFLELHIDNVDLLMRLPETRQFIFPSSALQTELLPKATAAAASFLNHSLLEEDDRESLQFDGSTGLISLPASSGRLEDSRRRLVTRVGGDKATTTAAVSQSLDALDYVMVNYTTYEELHSIPPNHLPSLTTLSIQQQEAEMSENQEVSEKVLEAPEEVIPAVVNDLPDSVLLSKEEVEEEGTTDSTALGVIEVNLVEKQDLASSDIDQSSSMDVLAPEELQSVDDREVNVSISSTAHGDDAEEQGQPKDTTDEVAVGELGIAVSEGSSLVQSVSMVSKEELPIGVLDAQNVELPTSTPLAVEAQADRVVNAVDVNAVVDTAVGSAADEVSVDVNAAVDHIEGIVSVTLDEQKKESEEAEAEAVTIQQLPVREEEVQQEASQEKGRQNRSKQEKEERKEKEKMIQLAAGIDSADGNPAHSLTEVSPIQCVHPLVETMGTTFPSDDTDARTSNLTIDSVVDDIAAVQDGLVEVFEPVGSAEESLQAGAVLDSDRLHPSLASTGQSTGDADLGVESLRSVAGVTADDGGRRGGGGGRRRGGLVTREGEERLEGDVVVHVVQDLGGFDAMLGQELRAMEGTILSSASLSRSLAPAPILVGEGQAEGDVALGSLQQHDDDQETKQQQEEEEQQQEEEEQEEEVEEEQQQQSEQQQQEEEKKNVEETDSYPVPILPMDGEDLLVTPQFTTSPFYLSSIDNQTITAQEEEEVVQDDEKDGGSTPEVNIITTEEKLQEEQQEEEEKEKEDKEEVSKKTEHVVLPSLDELLPAGVAHDDMVTNNSFITVEDEGHLSSSSTTVTPDITSSTMTAATAAVEDVELLSNHLIPGVSNYSYVLFTAPRELQVVTEVLPLLEDDDVLIETFCTVISPGTELKVYLGQLESHTPLDLTIDSLASSSLAYPVRYGYSLVGTVRAVASNIQDGDSLLNKRVFAFAPHGTAAIVKKKDLLFLSDENEDERDNKNNNNSTSSIVKKQQQEEEKSLLSFQDAAFLPSVETAVSLMMQAQAFVGQRVCVVGQGLIGLLTAATLKVCLPLLDLTVIDISKVRLALAKDYLSTLVKESMSGNKGGQQEDGEDHPYVRLCLDSLHCLQPSDPLPEEFDTVIEVSGQIAGLQYSMDNTRRGGQVVIASWYSPSTSSSTSSASNNGSTVATQQSSSSSPLQALRLGARFHRNEMQLVTSQVSRIPAALSAAWSKGRRFSLTLRMLPLLRPRQRLLTLAHSHYLEAARQAAENAMLEQTKRDQEKLERAKQRQEGEGEVVVRQQEEDMQSYNPYTLFKNRILRRYYRKKEEDDRELAQKKKQQQRQRQEEVSRQGKEEGVVVKEESEEVSTVTVTPHLPQPIEVDMRNATAVQQAYEALSKGQALTVILRNYEHK